MSFATPPIKYPLHECGPLELNFRLKAAEQEAAAVRAELARREGRDNGPAGNIKARARIQTTC